MRLRPRFGLLALSFALVAACDCKKGSTLGDPCTSVDDCDEGQACTMDVCTLLDGGEGDAHVPGDADVPVDSSVPFAIVGIELTPATPTLNLSIGVPDESLVFVVTASLQGGGTAPIHNASFSVDTRSAGVVDSSGRFHANGTIGGTVVVTASVSATNGIVTDSATITIHLNSTSGGGSGAGSPSQVFTDHPGTSVPAADADVYYPLDGAVMPQNVQPVDVQWACGAAAAPCDEADFFRVTIAKPDVTIVQYVRNDQLTVEDHFLVGDAAWRALAQTDPDQPATIRVDRWQASMNRVLTGTPVSVRFASTAITGTVYYWDIDTQTIRAIDDGTSTSRVLLPNINSPEDPNPHPADPLSGDRCVGCHSVSPSGRYMLADTNFSNYGALFDLTRSDLSSADPTPYEGFTPTTSIRWRLSSWNPGETRAMVSTAGGDDELALIDPFTGGELQAHDSSGANLGLPSPATMPAWGRDNAFVAFVSDNNSWAGETTAGNLKLLPVLTTGTDRFGTVSSLVASSALASRPEVGGFGSNGIFYPTWSPDSQYVAFANGTSSRSDPRDVDGAWIGPSYAHTSALYLVNRGGGGPVRLSRGSAPTPPESESGSGTADRSGLDFQPNFSPFQGGGYYWLSFLSRRPYGNREAGNYGGRTVGVGTQLVQPGQIWVMAIHVNPDGSTDPSEVAYWLPGQDPSKRAVSAFWAPRPCRANGDSCSVGSQCCGGDCRPPVGGGAAVCSPPDPSECRMTGQTCSDVTDCCGGGSDPNVRCDGNVCAIVLE